MSAQHTPGPSIYRPWADDGDCPAPWVVEDTDTRCTVLDAQGGLIADCTNGFDGDNGWVMSAAVGPLVSLIAVAPALLAIAERLALATDEGDDASQGTHYADKLGRIRCKGSFLALIEDARAAIAKATGSAS
jgi:hypothetical protein